MVPHLHRCRRLHLRSHLASKGGSGRRRGFCLLSLLSQSRCLSWRLGRGRLCLRHGRGLAKKIAHLARELGEPTLVGRADRRVLLFLLLLLLLLLLMLHVRGRGAVRCLDARAVCLQALRGHTVRRARGLHFGRGGGSERREAEKAAGPGALLLAHPRRRAALTGRAREAPCRGDDERAREARKESQQECLKERAHGATDAASAACRDWHSHNGT